jgi:hypothetical protein
MSEFCSWFIGKGIFCGKNRPERIMLTSLTLKISDKVIIAFSEF